MAKQQGIPQNTTNVQPRSFQKGMNKDINESLMPEGSYWGARNARNNSKTGDLGIIGNESSNEFCTQAPYLIIGAIHLLADKWVIFSTDETNSEIGLFDESACSYDTIVNDPCLNFSKRHLVIGESKENFDCSWEVYWDEVGSDNPSRAMNIGDITDGPLPQPWPGVPWVCVDTLVNPLDPDCIECVPVQPLELDCDRIRLARLTKQPCIKVEQGPNGGELLNGSYQASIAYTINEQRVTDYSLPSNLQPLFDHRNVNGSLDIIIEDIDETYDEFELAVIRIVNQQTVVKRVGIYSTHQRRISLDRIDERLTDIPIQLLPVQTPGYEKSEGIYRNGEYLLRVAPTTKFDFNYQPLANQIRVKWVGVELPADYYRKGGNLTSYLRDEQYALFIRWVYNTGDKSASYHIPGRPPQIFSGTGQLETDLAGGLYGDEKVFEVYNTATIGPYTGPTYTGEGTIVAEGDMGYWESTEIYPPDKPDIWDTLCGKKIRHHKMPDTGVSKHFTNGGDEIVILGLRFLNIQAPVDNNNNPIPGIVGYEILRGSREGNKTVLAKGVVNNMGVYNIPDSSLTGLYQNYPYNDLNPDPFLSIVPMEGFLANDIPTILPQFNFSQELLSFHSPDTNFRHPFLSANELKIYGAYRGTTDGGFVFPKKHPKSKVITDFGFTMAGLIGLGIAMQAIQGNTKSRVEIPGQESFGEAQLPEALLVGTGGTLPVPIPLSVIDASWLASAGFHTGATVTNVIAQAAADTAMGIATAISGVSQDILIGAFFQGAQSAGLVSPHIKAGTTIIEYDANGRTGLPGIVRIVTAIPTLAYYWSEGTDASLRLLRNILQYRQYALQYQSHCFYDRCTSVGYNTRRLIDDSIYVDDHIQEFSNSYRIQNLFRADFVALDLAGGITNLPTIWDTSRRTVTTAPSPVSHDDPTPRFTTPSACYYTGLKVRLRNQYGQVDGIIQVPVDSCTFPFTGQTAQSPVMFGGDSYIGRYTEKNSFFYFYDWMTDQPDGFEFRYDERYMLPNPTYWYDSSDFDANSFVQGLITWNFNSALPSRRHNFDRPSIGTGAGLFDRLTNAFAVKNAYFYLFNSGVRDFFVESEVNVEFRDWDDTQEKRHYDPYYYKDLTELFDIDIIKSGNFFKYDYSLSAGRAYQEFSSWGTMQLRNYDPIVAETCYTYYPNRVIYSLPQALELRYDNWKLYLSNNYKDFTSRVTAVKAIGKNGAIMLFENDSPVQIPGVEQLTTTDGTSITLGEGALFTRALQNLVNSDQSYEYGSCQDRLSVINTPAGLFWISQNQGKIFQFGGDLKEISQDGMKWWFDEYLPYKILEQFPNFQLIDNPVAGVGSQAIYDNSDGIVYFTKRDYRVREEFVSRASYIGGDTFLIRGRTQQEVGARVTLGDPAFFEDCSWTISYDPKASVWVSFHDWHPNLLLPSKNNFMSIAPGSQGNEIWKHNDRCDSYCNFYGTDYPFEVDMVLPTGRMVNTLKSVEYYMEAYVWDNDCVDQHHRLDHNFDRAVLYNTEQISGYLNLILSPKNNPTSIVNYPIINPGSIDILYSKEEQKYRFNQFWDITDDRGEFTGFTRNMWDTSCNGYVRTINPNYVNYNKASFERKKFRHYINRLWLQRRVSGDTSIWLKIVTEKNQLSIR